MVEITGTYDDDLRCTAHHGPSGARITTDAPRDNQGLGRSFSPTDLVAASLGTCVLTILGIVARRRGLDLSGARFRVEKEMTADPHRRIARLLTTIWLPARLPAGERERLEAAGRDCPIHHSLDPRIEAPIEFRYE